jgi:DNA primase
VATGENVVCTFGTSVGADEMAYLITKYDRFLVWYDYDPPGIKEGKNVTASLEQFADASQICENTRHGRDPKHFPRAAIRNIIKEYVYAK